MTFHIQSLPYAPFAPLFDMTDAELSQHNACRMVAKVNPGSPCRVSMQDAEVGEELILLNYQHLKTSSPYAATHAIFVRKGAEQAKLAVGEVPRVLSSRLLSVRCFDNNGMIIRAEVAEGAELAPLLKDCFADTQVDWIDLHNAKPGCFAAKVVRA